MNIIFVSNSPSKHFVTYPTISLEQFCWEFNWNKKKWLLDLETTGLTFNKNQMLLIALAPDDLSSYYAIDWVSVKDSLLWKYFVQEFKELNFTGHNLGFDLPFMLERGFEFRPNNIYDTMIVEQTLTKGTMESVSLQNTIGRRCKTFPLDKSIRMEFPLMSPTSPSFADRHIKYACEDLEWIPKIVVEQKKYLDKYDQNKLVELNNKMVYVNAKMKVAGMPVDRDKWIDLYHSNIKEADRLEVDLDQELIKIGLPQRKRVKQRSVQLSIVGDIDVVNKNLGNINFGSPSQLLDIFYALNLPRPTKSREDKDSMGEASVKQYMIKHKTSPIIPFLTKLLEYKNLSKKANTFGKKWIEKHLEDDGRVRSSFKINTTVTGRLSSNSPNLQQIPSDKAFRQCFVAPDGYKVWTADYSSAELRIMASLSGDVVMLDLIRRGADLHGYVATRVYRYLFDDPDAVVDKKNHTEFRTAIKNVIFGLSYGAGVGKIGELLDISKARAENVYDLLCDIFPQAFEMLEKNGMFAVQNGYIVFDKILNQRRWFGEILKGNKNKTVTSSVMRQAKNAPIQGVNGQMVKEALCIVDSYIESHNLESHIVASVHDEIVILVRDGEESHCETFHRLMVDAGSMYLVDIEMGVDSGIDSSWNK